MRKSLEKFLWNRFINAKYEGTLQDIWLYLWCVVNTFEIKDLYTLELVKYTYWFWMHSYFVTRLKYGKK